MAKQTYTGTFRATETVRVRSIPCIDGSAIRGLVSRGNTVMVSGMVGDWYEVTMSDGTVGWSAKEYYVSTASTTTTVAASTTKIPAALAGLAGRFLIARETGKLYYFHPATKKLLPLSSLEDLKVVAGSGESVTAKDIERIPKAGVANAFGLEWDYRTAMRGKILMVAGVSSNAWYVYPDTRRRYPLDFAERTLLVLRSIARTLSQAELEQIDPTIIVTAPIITTLEQTPSVEPTAIPTATPVSPTQVTTTAGVRDWDAITEVKTKILYTSKGSQIAGTGTYQQGTVPPGVDLVRINKYLLNRINKERTSRGQFPIVSDQRLIDTASVWAGEMFKQGAITHTRQPVNKIARVWAWENFKLDFAESWGWFYENIGGGTYDANGGDINASIEKSLDRLIDYFISEEKDNGIHFQTIMHHNLTHLGVGFYFDGGATSGKLYTVMHYAALAGRIPPMGITQ